MVAYVSFKPLVVWWRVFGGWQRLEKTPWHAAPKWIYHTLKPGWPPEPINNDALRVYFREDCKRDVFLDQVVKLIDKRPHIDDAPREEQYILLLEALGEM